MEGRGWIDLSVAVRLARAVRIVPLAAARSVCCCCYFTCEDEAARVRLRGCVKGMAESRWVERGGEGRE